MNNSPCESGRVLSARERVSHGCFSETLLPSRFKVLMSPAGQEGLMGSLMKNEVILYNYVSPEATCDNFEHIRYAR